jgi:hypothetical protein
MKAFLLSKKFRRKVFRAFCFFGSYFIWTDRRSDLALTIFSTVSMEERVMDERFKRGIVFLLCAVFLFILWPGARVMAAQAPQLNEKLAQSKEDTTTHHSGREDIAPR